MKLLESDVFGNGLAQWAIAAALSIGVLIVALLVRFILVRRLPAAEPGEEMHWPAVLHELVSRTWTLFLIIAAIYAGTTLLTLPDSVHRLVSSVFIVALFVQLAIWADRIAAAVLTWRLAPLKTGKSKSAMRNALSLIQFIVRVAVWSLALLLIFQNLGFDITALIAGLGVGGIAVALAAQSVLGDLFSSLAIILDRPFEVGDFIVFGDQSGTVEKIGIKTTRIRALSGEQIAVSNSDLDQDTRAQLQAHEGAPRRLGAWRHLRHAGGQAGAYSADGDGDHRKARASPLRSRALPQLRQLGSRVRGRSTGC